MKTTLELAEPLLRRARKLAARRGTTLKAVVEDALRLLIEHDEKGDASAGVVRTRVYGSGGLQPGLQWGDWETIRSLTYEGRGG